MSVAASLLLMLAANGAPILARQLLGTVGAAPLDAGLRLGDGRRLLGPSKTLRGVAAAVAACTALAVVLGYPATLGAAFGILAMTGDALSSLVKRRLGIEPSGRAAGLDQIPEALLPAALLRTPLGLSWPDVALAVTAFFVLELVLSRLLFQLRIRQRPY